MPENFDRVIRILMDTNLHKNFRQNFDESLSKFPSQPFTIFSNIYAVFSKFHVYPKIKFCVLLIFKK